MTAEKEENGKRADQMLDGMVQDADEYYNYLKGRHLSKTRLDGVVVGLVVWFAAFVALGVGAVTTIQGSMVTAYLLAAFLAAVGIGAVAGVAMYLIRRKRTFAFAELGTLVNKMKQGGASSEDGLHLMDAMHQASLVMRKRKMVSAFEYGVLAFALVALVGLNAGFGALAGVIVYLYFRFEALRDYEKEAGRYEDSKRILFQTL